MTVVPDDQMMTLICDTCGETTTGIACVPPDAEVVWTLVAERGWSGSPFATGPHRCPRCSPLPPVGEPPAGGDPGPDRPGVDNREPADDPGVGAALRHAVDTGSHVVVDLAPVRLIDSTGLGLLVRAHCEARDRGAVLCLAAPSRFVRTVLHTMRLDGVFPVFDSREEALAQLAAANPPLHA